MAVPVWSGVDFGPTGARIKKIIDILCKGRENDYYITSAYRPNETGSHHAGLTWNGSPTAAVDIGFNYNGSNNQPESRWLCEQIMERVRPANIVELIHAINPNGFYVKNNRVVGPYASAAHWNHIHLAMSRAEADAVLARLQDSGDSGGSGGGNGGGSTPDTYTVRSGDTLFEIAERFNTTIAKLVDLNNISNPDLINVGQVLVLPGGEAEPEPEPEPGGSGYDNSTSPIFGWDASDFDHDRGMRAHHIRNAAEGGLSFFTHKVTEGTRTIHTHCGDKLRAAADAGIPFIGAYVVVRTPGNNNHGSVSAQVNFAIDELDKQYPAWRDHPGFFWQVDLEKWSYDAVSQNHGVEMCRLLRERTDRATILYAPRWAYGNSIGGNDPLWNSHYVSGSGNYKSLYPGSNYPGWDRMSGRTPAILQYSSKATIGGQQNCDANAYRGTEADFAALIGAASVDEGEMLTVNDIWNTDGVVEAPSASPSHPDNGGTNSHWTAANVIRSTNDHARKLLQETRAAHAEQKLRDEAILAAIQGLDGAAVLTRVDEKAAELVAALNARADELAAQIAASTGVEVAAEDVVAAIGKALLSGGGTDVDAEAVD